jgi:hypothetical protein
MAPNVQFWRRRHQMVVCIDKFLQKVHQPAFRFTKVAAPPGEVCPEPEDNGPNDDPPSAIPLAA